MLIIQDLTKSYDGKNFVLSKLNLNVQKGELVVIVGSSGAGKSTLIRCINRLIEPSSGKIIVNGEHVESANSCKLRKIRSRIGMIFQHHNLIGSTNVITNVLHGRLGETPFYKSLFGLYKSNDKREARQLLESMGLKEQIYQKANTLSGGQMQRVGICRALMQYPILLLADEPIASLDPASANIVMTCIKQAVNERGLACIVNLHQVDFAKKYATRIIGLKNGKIIFDNLPSKLTDIIIEEIYGSL